MQLDRRGAEMLFQVLTDGRKPPGGIASNEGFSGWTKTVTDPRLCAAMIEGPFDVLGQRDRHRVLPPGPCSRSAGYPLIQEWSKERSHALRVPAHRRTRSPSAGVAPEQLTTKMLELCDAFFRHASQSCTPRYAIPHRHRYSSWVVPRHPSLPPPSIVKGWRDSGFLGARQRASRGCPARIFGSIGGWPLVWCHGGLSSALDAKFFDAAGQRCGADVIAIDRPGIGRTEPAGFARDCLWPQLFGEVANSLGLEDFAVAGWSAGGPLRAGLRGGDAAPSARRGHAGGHGSTRVHPAGVRVEVVGESGAPSPRHDGQLRAAAALLWLGRAVPDRYLAWEIRRTAGRRDRAALNGQALVGSSPHAGSHHWRCGGTAEDYRRLGNAWGMSWARSASRSRCGRERKTFSCP